MTAETFLMTTAVLAGPTATDVAPSLLALVVALNAAAAKYRSDVPTPSWRLVLRPQQKSLVTPLTVARAQVWSVPELMATTPVNVVVEAAVLEVAGAVFVTTATGTKLFVFLLFPSCPLVLRPQHITVAVVSKAQANPLPTETAVAFTVVPLIPVTGTGNLLALTELLPRAPSAFAPQQLTAPELRTTQADDVPRDTDLTPVSFEVAFNFTSAG